MYAIIHFALCPQTVYQYTYTHSHMSNNKNMIKHQIHFLTEILIAIYYILIEIKLDNRKCHNFFTAESLKTVFFYRLEISIIELKKKCAAASIVKLLLFFI